MGTFKSSTSKNRALDDFVSRLRFNATSHGADAAGGWVTPSNGMSDGNRFVGVERGFFEGYKEDIIWGYLGYRNMGMGQYL